MKQIKASEVREGMEIEWSDRGWYHRGVVAAVTRNHPGGVWLQSSDGFEMSVEPDQVITVLSEPQPDEPTAFGARVVVNGLRFLRAPMCSGDSTTWLSDSGFKWHKWAEILAMGPVTVVPDQGWTVPDGSEATPEVHDATEPRTWDRWEDVPDRVTVRPTDAETPYRKVGDRIECKTVQEWKPSVIGEYDLNRYSPFTEVPGA